MSLKYACLYLAVIILLLPSMGHGVDQKAAREQAQFDIYVGGKEMGQEKFSIQASGDSIASSSTLNFRDPGKSRQTVKIETELAMDERFVPRSYQLRTDVGGQKGIMKAVFAKGEASFEFLVNKSPAKSGLLVGDRFSVLDTNVFHHFVFIARLFDFDSKEDPQSMEVVIPQEQRNGILKVRHAGLEKVDIRGGKKELHHLKADTGTVQIDLWIDAQHVLYKIAVPVKRIEVIRN
jgi:hypothetical protein